VIDIWPFNLPPGPLFLWLYLGGCALLVVASFVAQHFVGTLLTRSPQAGVSGPAGIAVSTSTGPTLRIGRVPQGDECFAVAYARGGRDRLAAALLAAAKTDGWLRPDTADRWQVLHDAAVSSRALRLLHDELTTRTDLDTASIVAAARGVARRLEPEIEDVLERSHMRYTTGARLIVALVPIGCAFLAMGFAVLRVLQRQAMFPGAPIPTNLAIAVVITSAMFIGLAFLTGRKTPRLSSYLRWLDDATVSLRDDVERGRARQPDDTALAVAYSGLALLGMIGMQQVGAVLQPPPSTSIGSSCNSSSCSSSSCSSGGGCGSSCGGGGGCS
jgi:uncharacterized membrane protein YgcG